MTSVTLNKDSLLLAVQENRAKHAAEVEEAKVLYKAAFLKECQKILADAEAGKFEHTIDVVQPVDHVDEYDQVIDMLKMEVATEVKLTSHEFNQYVRDKWTWRAQAAFSNSVYKIS